MKLIPFAAAALLAASFAIGWATTPAPPTLEEVRWAPPRLAHAGEATRAALQALEALAPPAIQTVDIAEAAAPAPPPAPDIAVLFRRDLTAVTGAGRGAIVWIVDARAPSQRRGLRRGALYRDGWRIADIQQERILLRRGGARRTVLVMSAPAPDSVASRAPVLFPQGAAEVNIAPSTAAPEAASTPEGGGERPRRLIARPMHDG